MRAEPSSGAGRIRLVRNMYLDPIALIPLASGTAMKRDRLWNLDILNRTLRYGSLTASVIGLFMLVVVSLSTLFQISDNVTVAFCTMSLIALLFQPLRAGQQRVFNRLLYGERDKPYTVISRLGHRLETTLAPEAVLPTIVETVAQSLKLPYAAIVLRQKEQGGEALTVAATYGLAQDTSVRWPLVYQNEQVGELVLAPRAPGESFTAAERALLNDLAHQAGMAAHAMCLTAELKRLTVDLQRSREHLIMAREEERRRLRRDLHDGLGPQLASLTLKLETARNQLAYDPLADTLLRDLTACTQSAVADIRQILYTLRPPALEELGLLPALWEQVLQFSSQEDNGLHITIDTPDCLPELSAALEMAIYRITQESLTNVLRHALARHCMVRLTLQEMAITLEVQDDGGGMPAAPKQGVGLLSMRERAEELGGTWTMRQRPTGGTCVSVTLPYRIKCATPQTLT